MKVSKLVPALAASLLVASCGLWIGNQPQLPAPTAEQFPDPFATPVPTGDSASSSAGAVTGAPAATEGSASGPVPAAGASTPAPKPAYDPFADTSFTDVNAPTNFMPVFTMNMGSTGAGDSPAVATSVYQTYQELSVGEIDMLVEHVGFHFEKLQVGQNVGDGTVEIGTPPKLILPVAMQVEDTNQKDYALVSVKSDSLTAHIYIADLQIRTLYGSLAILSQANAARASAKSGNPTTPRSARVTETFSPGFVQLPSEPGNIRTRTIIRSVPDPHGNVTAQRVLTSAITIVK